MHEILGSVVSLSFIFTIRLRIEKKTSSSIDCLEHGIEAEGQSFSQDVFS